MATRNKLSACDKETEQGVGVFCFSGEDGYRWLIGSGSLQKASRANGSSRQDLSSLSPDRVSLRKKKPYNWSVGLSSGRNCNLDDILDGMAAVCWAVNNVTMLLHNSETSRTWAKIPRIRIYSRDFSFWFISDLDIYPLSFPNISFVLFFMILSPPQ